MKPKNILHLLLLGAIWGSSYLFVRIAAPTIGIPMTLGLRLFIGALGMIVIFTFLGPLPRYRSCWKQYLFLGVFNLLIPFGMTSFAVSHLNASISAILNATTPLFVMIISSLWLRERISVRKMAGLFLGLSGLVVLVGWMPIAFTQKTVLAVLFSLLASLSYSIATVYTGVFLKGSDPKRTATGQLSAAALLALPLFASSSGGHEFSIRIILVVLALGLVCTALGYALYFSLISSIGSANASLVTLVVPVFSVIWGIVFLDEPVTPSVIGGLVLMMGSLRLVLVPPKPKVETCLANTKTKINDNS